MPPSVVHHLIGSARPPPQVLGAVSRSSTQVEFITILIAAITAGYTLTFAAIGFMVEQRWLAGLGLVVVCLFMGLHTHAPLLCWGIVLVLVLAISMALCWGGFSF